MRYDNIFLRCEEYDESVTHVIFECPPALQTWVLEATPSHLNIFIVSSIYTNMDHLFWRKNNIEDPEMDIDLYPWIIWYLESKE